MTNGPAILYRVHPDAFPTYWFDRVKISRVDRVQARYMMGYDVSSETRDRGHFGPDVVGRAAEYGVVVNPNLLGC